jgi:putative transposase
VLRNLTLLGASPSEGRLTDNVLTKVPKGEGEMVATWIRTIFTMGTPGAVRAQLDHVAETLAAGHPRVAQMLLDAKADVTAFSDFPQAHWRKVWSTNPLERLNKEVKRRTDVVGIFPNTDALLRLSACVLIEAHDEWQDTDRRYLSEGSMALLYPTEPTALITTVTTVEEVPELATA